METHTQSRPSSLPPLHNDSFAPGVSVIYPMHGKCTVISIESRQIDDQILPFYKLEIQRSAFSRTTRQGTTIWVPVLTAQERGMRIPMKTSAQAESVFQILASREYYFDLQLPWPRALSQLETTIRKEGAIGLAKALSYLFVLKHKQIAPSSDVSRMSEAIEKVLYRELSEATGDAVREFEPRITKGFRQKLRADN